LKYGEAHLNALDGRLVEPLEVAVRPGRRRPGLRRGRVQAQYVHRQHGEQQRGAAAATARPRHARALLSQSPPQAQSTAASKFHRSAQPLLKIRKVTLLSCRRDETPWPPMPRTDLRIQQERRGVGGYRSAWPPVSRCCGECAVSSLAGKWEEGTGRLACCHSPRLLQFIPAFGFPDENAPPVLFRADGPGANVLSGYSRASGKGLSF
jgi:hypothetical protein